MSCIRVSKLLLTIVTLMSNVSIIIEAAKIPRNAHIDIDNVESKDYAAIAQGDSKYARQNQPEVENPDDVNALPGNLRYLFGKSREWSNFQHPKQLKRSGGSLQISSANNDSVDTNNPFPNYHCPINLLHGNNLTVKNYFLVIPHSNDSFNDTLQRIALLGEEQCQPKTKKTYEDASFKPMTESESLSLSPSLTTEQSSLQTTQASFENNTKTEEYSTKNIVDALISEHATIILLNTSEAESTTTTIVTQLGEEEKRSTASTMSESTTVVSFLASETRSNTPPPSPTTQTNGFLRTVDKYCETFYTRTASSPSASVLALSQTAQYSNFIPYYVDQLKRLQRNTIPKPPECKSK